MFENRRRAIVRGQILWMAIALVGLLFLGMFSPDFYYIVAFIGFLVVTQLFAPVESVPDWWRGVRLFVLAGFLVFGLLAAWRIVGHLG